jgi:hypothetical protein
LNVGRAVCRNRDTKALFREPSQESPITRSIRRDEKTGILSPMTLNALLNHSANEIFFKRRFSSAMEGDTQDVFTQLAHEPID